MASGTGTDPHNRRRRPGAVIRNTPDPRRDVGDFIRRPSIESGSLAWQCWRRRPAAGDLPRLSRTCGGSRGSGSEPDGHFVSLCPVCCRHGTLHHRISRWYRRRGLRAVTTNISTDLPTTALAVDGIYRRSRNPLYLAMTLVYLGLAIAAGSAWAIALLIPLLVLMHVGVIFREEGYLEQKFGDAYRQYKSHVRRWL